MSAAGWRPYWTEAVAQTRIPAPVPGLVFRYDYLRPRLLEIGVENPQERPACILLVLEEGEVLTGIRLIDEQAGSAELDYTAGAGDVVIFPIQSDPPDKDQLGVELSPATKAQVGLPGDKPSWAIISEVNVDRWPSPGIGRVPGSGQLAYPRPLPGPALSAIVRTFLRLRELKQVQAIARHP